MTDTPNSGTVSVSRELLENILGNAAQGYFSKDHGNILRAILAQPSCATPAGSACPGDGVGRCKACPLTDEPQDEPVGEIVTFAQILSDVSWRDGKMPALGTKLYLRPAAQAVKLPERKPIPCQSMTLNEVETWNACLDAVAKLNGIEP